MLDVRRSHRQSVLDLHRDARARPVPPLAVNTSWPNPHPVQLQPVRNLAHIILVLRTVAEKYVVLEIVNHVRQRRR